MRKPVLLPAQRRAMDREFAHLSENPDALWDDVPVPARRGPREFWTVERERDLHVQVVAVMRDDARPGHHRTVAGAIRHLLRDPQFVTRFVRLPSNDLEAMGKSLRNKFCEIERALGRET